MGPWAAQLWIVGGSVDVVVVAVVTAGMLCVIDGVWGCGAAATAAPFVKVKFLGDLL